MGTNALIEHWRRVEIIGAKSLGYARSLSPPDADAAYKACSMSDWYAMADLPPGTVRVRVRWAGYEVRAARVVDQRGRHHWHEIRSDNSLVPLIATPQAWQPEDAKRWRWPPGQSLPEPIPTEVEPRMAMIGGVAFDAATAAEEMEADRAMATVAAGQDRGEATIAAAAAQWWRDVTKVAYQPMGSVSPEMGEARILRHLILERTLHLDLKRPRSNAAVLADMKRSLSDVYGEETGHDWVPPLVPQPQDWADFEVVMGWLAEVGTTKRELSVLRSRMQAPPITWVQIGDALEISPRRARAVYDAAIEDLIGAANRPARRGPARMAALRERNREAKR